MGEPVDDRCGPDHRPVAGTADCVILAAMSESPQEYLSAAPEAGRPWLTEFWDYMSSAHPELEPTMFWGVPMYKFGRSYLDGYVMFTAARSHFAVHALEFDLVERFRSAIAGAAGGKGSVTVKYSAESAKPALREFVDAVIARHSRPEA